MKNKNLTKEELERIIYEALNNLPICLSGEEIEQAQREIIQEVSKYDIIFKENES